MIEAEKWTSGTEMHDDSMTLACVDCEKSFTVRTGHVAGTTECPHCSAPYTFYYNSKDDWGLSRD